MSALKKQSTLRWSYTNELTPSGAIAETVWKSSIGKFLLEVTNWTGTKTLGWSITMMGSAGWRISGTEHRYEYTVSTLKDMVCRKAEELNGNNVR